MINPSSNVINYQIDNSLNKNNPNQTGTKKEANNLSETKRIFPNNLKNSNLPEKNQKNELNKPKSNFNSKN